ncbi:MAG: penicillin-insensitive murein endopeptidase [Nannocystaceae bacterium]
MSVALILRLLAAVAELEQPEAEIHVGTIQQPPAGTDTEETKLAPTSKRPPFIRHVVVPRETLQQLAYRYRVHPRHILRTNKIEPDEFKKGAKLKLRATANPPPRERREWTVGEGDTWVSIARAHGAESSDMRRYNHRVGRTLEVGEKLVIWSDPTLRDAYETDKPPPGPAAEIRPGAFSIGPPNDGHLVNGVRVPASDHYDLRYPNSAWGTTLAARSTVIACQDFRDQSGYRGELRLGTMSRKRGGPIGGHKSHQSGRDLDIRLPLRETVPQRLSPRPHRVDWLATWELIQAFHRTGAVIRIFLDYRRQRRMVRAARAAGAPAELLDELVQWPRGSGSNLGLVRHSSGHTGHIHIRFGCAPHEVECIE